MAARRRGGRRMGTFLVLAGIAGVLSATFLAGFWTGHNWPALVGNPKPPSSEASSTKRGGGERSRPADALPALTFYDELKAPLTAPPPPPVRASKPPRATEPARREIVAEPPPAPVPASLDATRVESTPAHLDAPVARVELPAAAPADAVARFTVQVAAYNVRTQADALRATLAAAGHDARVVEAQTPGGVRYRVQVGLFPTRPAAQDAAARLATERSLATFVTTTR